ncbi:MAG: hypothetical protein ACJAUP_003003 [Cellvibrionaceae bacterium]|jgi:hypothetical protein
MNSSLSLATKPIKVLTLLLSCAFLLALAHIVSFSLYYYDAISPDDWYYFSLFDLDEEESIGTWFSALILFFAAQLLLLIAMFNKGTPQTYRLSWFILAFGFCFLSLDEVAGFHELINTVVTIAHWTFFGLLAVILVAIIYARFLWNLPTRTRSFFIVSGLIYIGGAIGIEWSTIWYEEHDHLDSLAYNLWNALEELLEMLGVSVFIYALLDYMSRLHSIESVKVAFEYPCS